MNVRLIKMTSAVLVSGLILSGCENMSPETQGTLAGLGAGALAGGVAKAAGMSDSSAVAIGMASGAAVGYGVYVLAKHQATERQRKVAEERARLAYQQMSAQRKASVRKHRYIAVATVRESDSKGAKSVMVYDTQTQQVVGNNVYDVKQSPKEGTVSKYDTYTAEYVGGGA